MTKQEYLKHKDLIEEWAKGSKIEFYCDSSKSWFTTDNPAWSLHIKYRLEKSKPKWEDFGVISGWYVSSNSELIEYPFMESCAFNKNIFPTIGEAKACLALSQLCQWRDMYNDGWKPDWSDGHENKYTIFFKGDEATKGLDFYYNTVLSFKSEKIRDKFLEDFTDLIETAKPLL